MRNIVSVYADKFRHERRAQIQLAAVLLALAVVVAGVVFWQLRDTGVAMANETYCGYEEHTHSADCYAQTLTCGMEEGDSEILLLDAAGDAEEAHVHDASCYAQVLICDIPEHVHSSACMVDETADVETADDWEATLPELTGVWADDVVAVAESQLGYTESGANYQLSEDGETHQGYTRYGAWYGNAYGDWDAMFASFVLHYAGVSEEDFPQASGAYAWIAELGKLGLYADAAEYTPTAGDLIFFDTDEDGEADHVGIVAEVGRNRLTVIEGDAEDSVQKLTCQNDDESIVGYGVLPVVEIYEAPELTEQTISATIYSDASAVQTLSEAESIALSGLLPENGTVAAYPVDVTIGDMTVLAAYDITIYDENGHEYEPESGQIRVTMTNSAIRNALSEGAEPTVYHINDQTDQLETVGGIAADGVMEFDAESFSIYIVGDDDGYYNPETGTTVTVYTVEFYQYEFDASDSDASKGPTLVSTQYVAETDRLNEPAVPEYEHHVFDGWFTEQQVSADNEPGNKFDFSLTLKANLDAWGSYTVGEHHTISLYTDYDPVYYVYFMTEEEPILGSEDDEDYVSYVFHTDTYHENYSALDTTDVGILYWQQYLQLEGEDIETTATTYAVVDWYYYDETGSKVNISTQLDSDGYFHIMDNMTLYPVVEGAIWMFFDMNIENTSEVYIEPSPAYVLSGTNVGDSLPDAERQGYTFNGWWTEETGGTQITSDTTFDSLLTYVQYGEVTLYAHWTPTKVGYTVNIWRQKATDGQEGLDQKNVQSGEEYEEYIKYYDYAESITIEATDERALTTGSTNLTYTDFGSYTTSSGFGPGAQTTTKYYWEDWTGYGWTTGNNGSDGTDNYVGFEYNQTRTENDLATITVQPDGSTIINIFYDRVTVTYHFGTSSSNPDSTGTLIGLYDTDTKVADGVTPGGTLNGWPSPNGSYQWQFVSDYSGRDGYSYTGMSFLAKFALTENYSYRSNVVYFTSSSTRRSSTLYYYLEVTNPDKQVTSSSQTVDVNNTTYVLDYTLTFGWGSSNTSTSNFTITDKYIGYTAVGYRTSSNGRYNDITAEDSNKTVTLSGNDTLYIFNDALEYNIELYSNHNGEQEVWSDTFKYGQDLTSVTLPTELDAETYGPAYYYQFTGTWWEDPTFTAVFQKPDTMPANNLVAYANWELKDITVTFVSSVDSDLYDLLVAAYGAYDEDSNPGGVVENDDGSYSVIIKASESVSDTLATLTATPDEGEQTNDRYTFVSWMNGSSIFNVTGHLYDDTTLVASWNDSEKEHHKLYYVVNLEDYGGTKYWTDGVEHSVTAESGEELYLVEEVFNATNTGVKLSEEQIGKFICWNTESDGSGTDYYPDDLYDFSDAHEDVILYAKWAVELESTLHIHYNYPDGYDASVTGEHPDVDITVENLGTVDLGQNEPGDEGGYYIALQEGEEIVIAGVTYRFVGWSTDQNATSAEIEPGATVAVDGTDTDEERINNLYAVWLAELQFTIEKTNANGDELEGAVFTLSYTKTTEVEGEETTTTTCYYSYDETTQSYSWAEANDPTNPPTITLGTISFTDHNGDFDGSETFTLTEVTAPEGYDELANAITFTLNVSDSTVQIVTNVTGKGGSDLASAGNTTLTVQNEKVYSVDIFKYDSETEEPLEGVIFVLGRDGAAGTNDVYYAVFTLDETTGVYTVNSWNLNYTGSTSYNVTTNEEGKILIDGLVPGTYWLREDYVLDGYLTPTTDFEFTIGEDGTITSDYLHSSDAEGGEESEPGESGETGTDRQLDIPNVQQSLDVLKTDEDGLPLEGAEFVMGTLEQQVQAASVPVEDTDYYYEYLTFTTTGGSNAYVYSSTTDTKSEATTLITTGEDGTFNVTGLYPGNVYFLIETKAPTGYDLLDDSIVFYIDYDGTIYLISPVESGEGEGSDEGNEDAGPVKVDGSTITVMDEKAVFDVMIYKYADDGNTGNVEEVEILYAHAKPYAVTNNALSGAEFTLSKTVTNEDGTSTTMYVVADSSTDSQYGYVYYTITDWTEDSTQATTLVTDSTGYIEFLNMEAGTYTLTETKAPEGYYLLTESIVFTVDTDGSLTVVSGPADTGSSTGDDGTVYTWITVANTEITGAFDPEKVNGNSEALQGAEFILGWFAEMPVSQISETQTFQETDDGKYEYYYAILNYDEESTTYIFDWSQGSETRNGATTMTTDENGKLSISNLPVSSVYETGFFLIETKAPDGYALLEDPIVFLVNDDGTVSIVVNDQNETVGSGSATMDDDGKVMTIVDEPGPELPMTGGVGATWFYVIGGVLICGAGVVLVRRRRMNRAA